MVLHQPETTLLGAADQRVLDQLHPALQLLPDLHNRHIHTTNVCTIPQHTIKNLLYDLFYRNVKRGVGQTLGSLHANFNLQIQGIRDPYSTVRQQKEKVYTLDYAIAMMTSQYKTPFPT